MLKRIIRSIAVVVLVVALISSSTVAYAAEGKSQIGYNVQVTQLSENKVQVVENGEISIIEVSQINGFVTEVRVTGPDDDTLTLTVDRNRETITSSKTGETIKLSELLSYEKEIGTRYTSKTKVYSFSYAKIKKLLDGAANIATIAAVIFALIALPMVSGVLSKISDLLSAISGIVKLVTGGSSSHGLKVTLKSYQRTVHHGNESALVEYWKVTKIAKY